MTYCLAIKVDSGLIFASDSCPCVEMAHLGTCSKMHTFTLPNRRFFTLLSAGNFATAQAVVTRLRADCERRHAPSLCNVPDVDAAVSYVGNVSADVQHPQGAREVYSRNVEATFIFGGQIGEGRPAIFLVYPQGNYIHESSEHPFLQVGETKYGKPILDRVIGHGTALEIAARCALVSLNSTIRSSIAVAPPIELLLYTQGSYAEGRRLNLSDDDPFYRTLSDAWCEGLRQSLNNLPPFDWEPAFNGVKHAQHDVRASHCDYLY